MALVRKFMHSLLDTNQSQHRSQHFQTDLPPMNSLSADLKLRLLEELSQTDLPGLLSLASVDRSFSQLFNHPPTQQRLLKNFAYAFILEEVRELCLTTSLLPSYEYFHKVHEACIEECRALRGKKRNDQYAGQLLLNHIKVIQAGMTTTGRVKAVEDLLGKPLLSLKGMIRTHAMASTILDSLMQLHWLVNHQRVTEITTEYRYRKKFDYAIRHGPQYEYESIYYYADRQTRAQYFVYLYGILLDTVWSIGTANFGLAWRKVGRKLKRDAMIRARGDCKLEDISEGFEFKDKFFEGGISTLIGKIFSKCNHWVRKTDSDLSQDAAEEDTVDLDDSELSLDAAEEDIVDSDDPDLVYSHVHSLEFTGKLEGVITSKSLIRDLRHARLEAVILNNHCEDLDFVDVFHRKATPSGIYNLCVAGSEEECLEVVLRHHYMVHRRYVWPKITIG